MKLPQSPSNNPSLEHLKKQAKHRLQALRKHDSEAQLATAQFQIAREQGFPSWRALKANFDQHRAKKIASPVMRYLPVADIARSIAFYRDLLGFAIHQQAEAIEATLGPVRIRFGKTGYAPIDSETPKVPGSAILFLETEDVELLHKTIQSRGLTPSPIEKVNWIKMRLFELRDPDLNVLWFGQSYHQQQDNPSRRDQQPQGMRQAVPQLPCDNVPAAVTYYRDTLGFKINYQQEDLGVMDRDAIEILLIARTPEHKGIGSCGIFVSDVDTLYAEYQAKGAHTEGPPISYPWGIRDFKLIDPEGNRLMFMQTFE